MASRRPNECALNVVVHCLAAVLFYGCAAAQENVRVPAPDSTRAQTEPVQSFEEFAAIYQGWVQETATSYSCADSVAPLGNELHDCQRLVVFDEERRPPRAAFGPLVGIYPILSTVGSVTDYSTPRLVALVVNYGATAEYQGNTVTYASEEYSPLEIVPPTPTAPATHCLWLRETNGRWEAAMAPPARNQSSCDQGQPPNPSQWNLEVQRESYANALFDAYPNTARWRWTRAHVLNERQSHFIGIKCAVGWCQIGPRGFNPFSLPQPMPRWTPSEAIPGFRDGQFLAVEKEGWRPNADMGGPFEPGPWAEIRPLRVPHGWNWVRPFEVAAIEVDPAQRGLDEYDRKLGLGQRGGMRVSRVVLQRSSSGPGTGAYMHRYSNATALSQGVIPSRLLHGVSGSARWRWHDDTDETVWVSCWAGCCELRAAN